MLLITEFLYFVIYFSGIAASLTTLLIAIYISISGSNRHYDGLLSKMGGFIAVLLLSFALVKLL